jgi:hypothetical protein
MQCTCVEEEAVQTSTADLDISPSYRENNSVQFDLQIEHSYLAEFGVEPDVDFRHVRMPRPTTAKSFLEDFSDQFPSKVLFFASGLFRGFCQRTP